MNIIKKALLSKKLKEQEKIEVNVLNRANKLSIENELHYFDGREGIGMLPFFSCPNAKEIYENGNPILSYDENVGRYCIQLKNSKCLYITEILKNRIQNCIDEYLFRSK